MAVSAATRRQQIRRWLDYYDGADKIIRDYGPGVKRVRFPPGVVFLAAAQSGNFEETVSLLKNGADPNSCTADGLTAHHQCCIDGNLDMLKVLVENGADVDAKDNEGWTPLHATASCDRADILEFLVENGAQITAVNNEGEIAVDLCDEDSECLGILEKAAKDQKISLDEAREAERRTLLEDAKSFKDNKNTEFAKSMFGATPLHIASAKGYDDVIRILLETNVDVDARDDDGWTPLHAAAHWGEKVSCQLLADAGADFEKKTPSGQTVAQVADPDLTSFVETLKKSQLPKKSISSTEAGTTSQATTPRLDRRRGSITRSRSGSQSKLDMSAERSKMAQFRARLQEDGNKAEDEGTVESVKADVAPLKPPSFSPKPPSAVTTTAAETSATSESARSSSGSSTSASTSSERAPVASSLAGRKEQSADSKSNESVPLSAGVGRRTSNSDISSKVGSVQSRLDLSSSSSTSAAADRHDAPRKSMSDRLAMFGGGRVSPSTSLTSVATVAESTSNASTTPAKTDTTVPTTEAEPEAVRRSRARRSRENRRVTQHVRREDLMQAAGSPSPDGDLDDRGSMKSSDSREDLTTPPSERSASPSITTTSASPVADNMGLSPESAENGTVGTSLSVSDDQKSSRNRHRRNRAKRRPTGIITLSGEANSDSDVESETGNDTLSVTSTKLTGGSSSHECSCSSRLSELGTQLTSMTENFQADRQRMTNLEKELKQLREENRALIRVIAKLSRSST